MASTLSGPPSPRVNITAPLLRKLSSAVNGQAANATFACGGSIPIADLQDGDAGQLNELICPPVTIRWDHQYDLDAPAKITFPSPNDIPETYSRLEGLIRRCQPATFGVDGRIVLDETYRKAGKLDNTAFSTDFHPHTFGIVDAIQQVLLSSTVRGAQDIGIGLYRVRADLYELNVSRLFLALEQSCMC